MKSKIPVLRRKQFHSEKSTEAETTPTPRAATKCNPGKSTSDEIAPPFFTALKNFVEKRTDSWHCPGHSSGTAFLKTAVGKIFHQFFGENLLRADVCNAVEELGQLLDHTGPIAEAEKNAARIFNSDHLFFVTNGTSTSNKIVWHSVVGPDDIVIVDRNCHKSILHAIMMTGATPIYLTPTRNHYGIIGPIPDSEFNFETIERKIAASPFIKNKKPRILTLTQSTYDGICYNVETIKQKLDGNVHALHFDEAWLAHAAFHPFYKDMHAIGVGRARANETLVFSTQSTHKMLAGLSQASQILVQDAEQKKLNKFVFNEAYMMHTSTSPQYSIIASCDVSAAMMDGAAGVSLIQQTLTEALNFRRALQQTEKDYPENTWFKVWGPETTDIRAMETRDHWILKPGEAWHGFGDVSPNFNLLDPLKTTILTPGVDASGHLKECGIPASIVSKYLAQNGVMIEKVGLYSFFVMFTLGVDQGKWTKLISVLKQFKSDYDNNVSVAATIPLLVKSNQNYLLLGLKDLCQKIHTEYKAAEVLKMTSDIYLSELVPAMKPSDAFAKIAHEEIQRIAIGDLKDQITAVLLTPYPPGIPLLVPGERFNKTIVDYLKFTETFNNKFPGFESDVHGLVCETICGEKKYFVDCVKIE
jgi:arginine decarboxylase